MPGVWRTDTNVPRIRTNEQFSWRHGPGFAGRNEPVPEVHSPLNKEYFAVRVDTLSNYFIKDISTTSRACMTCINEAPYATEKARWKWRSGLPGETTVKVSTYKNTSVPRACLMQRETGYFICHSQKLRFSPRMYEGGQLNYLWRAHDGAGSATCWFIYATLFSSRPHRESLFTTVKKEI